MLPKRDSLRSLFVPSTNGCRHYDWLEPRTSPLLSTPSCYLELMYPVLGSEGIEDWQWLIRAMAFLLYRTAHAHVLDHSLHRSAQCLAASCTRNPRFAFDKYASRPRSTQALHISRQAKDLRPQWKRHSRYAPSPCWTMHSCGHRS